MKKNLSVIIIVLFALFLGGGYYLSIKVQKTNIYQFNVDKKAGTTITQDMLVPMEVDKKMAESAGYITDSTLKDVVGRTIVTDVFAGMPLMENYVSQKANSSVVIRLADGKVAYSIPGDAISLVTSGIRYGNYVNIYASIESQQGKITKLVLPNVRILDVVRTGVSEDNPQGTLAGVTLELDPNDITKMIFAQQYGKVSIGLLKDGGQKLTIDESKQFMDFPTFVK